MSAMVSARAEKREGEGWGRAAGAGAAAISDGARRGMRPRTLLRTGEDRAVQHDIEANDGSCSSKRPYGALAPSPRRSRWPSFSLRSSVASAAGLALMCCRQGAQEERKATLV